MKSKTCGECKHCEIDEITATCNLHCLICNSENSACKDFEPKVITNGDKIRSMSNEELATLLVYTIRVAGGLKFMYSSHLIDDCYHEKEKAIQATVAKLNEVCDG